MKSGLFNERAYVLVRWEMCSYTKDLIKRHYDLKKKEVRGKKNT